MKETEMKETEAEGRSHKPRNAEEGQGHPKLEG